MGYDRKYGKVTFERGNIGEYEPVVVFRAKDVLLPDVLYAYVGLCMSRASVDPEHIKTIIDTHATIRKWHKLHGAKVPDTEPGQAIDQSAIDMVRED